VMNAKLDRLTERLRRAQQSPTFVQPKRFFLQQAERVDYLQTGLKVNLRKLLDAHKIKLSAQESKLARLHPEHRIKLLARNVNYLKNQLDDQMKRVLDRKKMNIVANMKQLDALSPLKVMARGYSLTYTDNQQLLKNIEQVKVGNHIEVRLADGTLNCEVQQINSKISN